MSTAGCTRSSAWRRTRHTPCIFEYVYFARPDSIIDNISVTARACAWASGSADKILRERPDHDIDVVIPIPDTSRTCAHAGGAAARTSSTAKGSSRTATSAAPSSCRGRNSAAKSVRQQAECHRPGIPGKNVLLVDDSIVRGTTSAQIIEMAREAGARKVYFASAAPPVRYPNVYGIDMPAASELVAAGRSDEEVAQLIGADWLIYQDLEDLIAACVHDHSSIKEFDTSCFSGNYVTGDVTPEYLHRLEQERSDGARAQRRDSPLKAVN